MGVLVVTTTVSGSLSFFQRCNVLSVNCSIPPCTGSPSNCKVYQHRSSKSKANFLFRR